MDSFFGIGFPELVTIMLLAGIVMGPERIGRVARWLGRVTAQLQAVSRSFMRQLTAELEAADSGGELKSAMQDIQDLQRQLAELRGELHGQATSALREGKESIEEIEKSIQPPTLNRRPSPPPKNGRAVSGEAEPPLPRVVNVPDDPE